MTEFTLHPRLEADSVFIAHLKLCEVRLQTDANYPWLNLIPVIPDAREIHKLTPKQQQTLWQEISFVSEKFEVLTKAEKLNVATLGNMVPQLHIHIIARYEGDPAWPGSIWGLVPRKPYAEATLETFIEQLQEALNKS